MTSSETFGTTPYNYTDKEFRGFALVIEKRPDSATIHHFFHQGDIFKGKEYKTEIYDASGNIMSKSVSGYSYIDQDDYFVVALDWQSSYTHDGTLANPEVTNTTYSYDSYGNPVWVNSLGDIHSTGLRDQEHHSYVFSPLATNPPSWL